MINLPRRYGLASNLPNFNTKLTSFVRGIYVGGVVESLRYFRRPKFFRLYILLAFLTVLMTCFGVNYFLGGYAWLCLKKSLFFK